MSKAKNFIIPLVVYPFDLMVSVGEGDLVLHKKLVDAGVDDAEANNSKYTDESCVGRFCMFGSGQLLIRIKSKPETPKEYGILHHEIFHCVAAFFWKIGMKLKIKISDEAYAYLIQYLTEEIYSKL